MQATELIRTQVQEATSGNEIYNTYLPQWQYLLESYLGGEDYRRANHLVRYKMETEQEYLARVQNTPLDNQCKSIIATYISFLFRQEPSREFNSMELMPELSSILEDADYEGRSFTAFMKQVATWSSVFGHCWVIVSKPNIGALTRADELAADLRPYLSLLTPMAVLDWQFTRTPIGRYTLSKLKYLEDVNGTVKTIKTWTSTEIKTETVDDDKKILISEVIEPNQLGMIPAVIAYSTKSIVRGIGISDISDVADAQRMIYNCTSEVLQSIQLDSHPSLVTTTEVQVGVGAGAVIKMPDNMDSGLKPYVLDFGGANVQNILQTITHLVGTIDKMCNTGAIRTTETRDASGIAIQTEFELLNARLAEKADSLQLAEEQIWQIIALYQGYEYDMEITYPDSFNIRDKGRELTELEQAKRIATDPTILQLIDHELMEAMDLDYEDILLPEDAEEELDYEEHPTTTPENRQGHIQTMIMEGYTDEEILNIHPEITSEDIASAKAALLV